MTDQIEWKLEELPSEQIKLDPRFQFRADGIDQAVVKKLTDAQNRGETLPPLKVAKIGKAYYLVDGFHRMAVHGDGGPISVEWATMSLPEARDYARTANTRHGKNLSNKDKQRIFGSYVDDGKHVQWAGGPAKASRTISAELGGIYSHTTIRTKLKQLGVEIDEDDEYPDGYYQDDRHDEDVLEDERVEQTFEALDAIMDNYATIPEADQKKLVEDLKALLGRIERGEPARPEQERLDI